MTALIITCALIALCCFIIAGAHALAAAEEMMQELNDDLDHEEHF